jgi:IMP dehydrogenase
MATVKSFFAFGLTFDDISLLPGYSDFERSEIVLSTKLTRGITLSLPFVSSPMDTVTEGRLAIALGKLGGIGIIHRNLSIEDQVKEVLKVKREKLLVGGAIGVGNGFEKRLDALFKALVDVVVLDSAHGFSKGVIEATSYVKRKYPKLQLISGNIATSDGAKALIKAGADGLRVGMGPGAICTTRVVSGMGVPQITAISETVKVGRLAKVPIIADGGIRYSGDITKALGVGASTVMMGSFFASSEEAPGKTIRLKRDFVPKRFLSIFEKQGKRNGHYLFKEYRGMGSEASMEKGAKVKSEGEFHGKSYYKDKVLVAEGVEGLVPVKGSVKDLLDQAIGGLKSGMYYVGAKNISELSKKARFMQLTHASLLESHPHSILITNKGKSYE